jgi:SnoaL-like protein
MTTPPAGLPAPPGSDGARFAVAGAFLDGLAAQDFSHIAATLHDTAHLAALLPRGPAEWDGPDQIGAAFRRWFGEVDRFELVDAAVGEVGPRLHLRWRVRVQAEARGNGWLVIEQQMYADAGPDGRLTQLSLLCSGFHAEASPRAQASSPPASPPRARSPR